MNKVILKSVFAFLIGSTAFAQSIVNCVDGSRSMKVVRNNGALVGQLIDFNLRIDNMKCGVIPNTKTLRCDSAGDYYVLISKLNTTDKLTVQLNLKGDFYPDSGYVHSLNCQ
jgi:hypothetical protein